MEALVKINDARSLGALEDFFVDNGDLSKENELMLKAGLKGLGTKSFLFLHIRRYLWQIVLVIVLIVIVGIAWTSSVKLQTAETQRIARVRANDFKDNVAKTAEVMPDSKEGLLLKIKNEIGVEGEIGGKAYYLRGQISFMDSKFDDAKRDLEEAARRCDDSTKSHISFMLGLIFEKREDETYAFRSYTKSMRLYNKEALGSIMSMIAAKSAEDSAGNIEIIKNALPYHGEFTIARIIGKDSWEKIPGCDISSVLNANDSGEVIDIATVVEVTDDLEVVAVATVVEVVDAAELTDAVVKASDNTEPMNISPVASVVKDTDNLSGFNESNVSGEIADEVVVPEPKIDPDTVSTGVSTTGQFIDDPDSMVTVKNKVEEEPEAVPVGGAEGMDALDSLKIEVNQKSDEVAEDESTEVGDSDSQTSAVLAMSEAAIKAASVSDYKYDGNASSSEGNQSAASLKHKSKSSSANTNSTTAGVKNLSETIIDGPDDEDDSLKTIRHEANVLIEKAPSIAGMAYYRRGLLNVRAGLWKEAIADLDAAQSMSPVELQVHLNFLRGRIFQSKGNTPKAAVSYWRALRLYDSELFQEAIVDTADINSSDFNESLEQVVSRLPFHGEITASRILGMKSWEEYTFST